MDDSESKRGKDRKKEKKNETTQTIMEVIIWYLTAFKLQTAVDNNLLMMYIYTFASEL